MDAVTLGLAQSSAAGQYVATQPINAAKYGYSHANTDVQNQTALQLAANVAIAAGQDLAIPRTGPFGTAIPVANQINITGAGYIKILGSGAGKQVKIHQTVKPDPIFYVTAPGVVFEDFACYGDGLNMNGTAGPIDYARYCGIWFAAGSDYGVARRIYAEGLHRAVRLDPDPTTISTTVPNTKGIRVEGIEVKACWCAVTVAGQTDFVISKIRGSYQLATSTDGTDVGQPSHLVYVIDRTAYGVINYNPSIWDCMAWDGVGGKAYAIKGCVGGSSGHLLARNCYGLLDLIANTDHNLFDIESTLDTYAATEAYASISYTSDNVRTNIYGARVTFANLDHGPALMVDGLDNIVRDMSAVANRVTESVVTGGPTLFSVKGTRCRVENPVAHSIAANIFAGITCTAGVSDQRVINPRTSGNIKYGVFLAGGSNIVVDYDPAMLQTNGVLNGATDLGSTGTTAKAVAVASGVPYPKLRPRDRALPNGPENFFFDCGTYAANTLANFRATSGQAATVMTGSWTLDTTVPSRGRIKNTSTSTTVPGVQLYSTARESVDTASGDFDFTLDIVYGATNAAALVGIAFRGTDNLNTLGFAFTGTGAATPQLELFKAAAGTITVLGTPTAMTAVIGRKYRLRVVVVGNVIQCYLDGTLVQTYTLTGADITTYATLATVGYYVMLSGNTLICEATGRRMS